MISIIAAIGKNNELGRKNALLWKLPLDMRHFRKTTSGHPVIMGQNTFESLGRPLPNRRNIVLTRDPDFRAEGAELAYSPEEALEMTDEGEENFIIGGGQIYKLFMEKADRLYITHVDAQFPDADTYFPAIDPGRWKITSEESHGKDDAHAYPLSFKTYERK